MGGHLGPGDGRLREPRAFVHLVRHEERWPARLESLVDPPAALYLQGDVSLLSRTTVAVVGARRASASGVEIARRLGRDLGAEGILVASGLARGIDASAHRGALDGGAPTLGVLGTGLDVCYPHSSRDIHARCAAGEGLLVTELDPGMPPLRHHFPMRNRILAALASAVVVVEGAARSGSRITADLALDLGREVLAVPRDPLMPGAETPNALIRQGAAPVTGARDVLDALEMPPGPARRREHTAPRPPERLVWLAHALEPTPLSPEEIVERTGRDVVDVLPGLLDLELRGFAERDPAGRYRSCAGTRS